MKSILMKRLVHPVPRKPEGFFPDAPGPLRRAGAGMAARPVRWRIEWDKPWYGVHVVGVAALSVATVTLGFLFAVPPGNVAVIWPPSGMAFVAGLLAGGLLFTWMLVSSIQMRRRAEQALQRVRDELETRVQERTEQLAEVVSTLKAEVTQRTQTTEQLRAHMQQLETMNRIMIDRELRILELKEALKVLHAQPPAMVQADHGS